MKPTFRRVLGAVLAAVAAAFAVPHTARADASDPLARLAWWVEGRPWTCADPVAPVARQAELACDASGGRCHIAQTREEADRIAALTCAADKSAWRLDAEDRHGRVLWSVVLTGDVDARARKAGLWIARAEEKGPPPEDSPAPPPSSAPPAPPAPAPPAEPAPGAGGAEAPPPEDIVESPPHVRATTADEGAHRSHGFRRFWIGGAVSFDFFAMPAANDVCLLDLSGKAPATAGNPYNCVDPGSKSSFPDTATTNASIAKHGDLVQSGAAIGNTRLLVSFDYALSPNLLLGVRAGYVFATDPGSYPSAPFRPVHVEARATYLFGDDAIRRGFAPMVLVATGVGEFDAYVQVPVFLNQPQGGTPIQRPENAWLTAGPAFVAAGPGMRILLTEEVAATAALKFETAFGGSAGTLFGAAPEVALQLGF